MNEVLDLVMQYAPMALAVISQIAVIAAFLTKVSGALDNVRDKADAIQRDADFVKVKEKLDATIETNKALVEEIRRLNNKIDKLEE